MSAISIFIAQVDVSLPPNNFARVGHRAVNCVWQNSERRDLKVQLLSVEVVLILIILISRHALHSRTWLYDDYIVRCRSHNVRSKVYCVLILGQISSYLVVIHSD